MSQKSTSSVPSVVGQPLQFVPISSEVELPFYSALFSYKLEHDKLDDSVRQVVGLYEPNQDSVEPERSCKLQILGNALTSDHGPIGSSRAEGTIKNFNTVEEFKKINHTQLVQNAGRMIWDAINDGSIYSVPSLLSSFNIVSFADLKKYTCTYWFNFPAIHSSWVYTADIGRFTPEESTHFVERVGSWRYSVDSRQRGFFLEKKVPWLPGSQPEENQMSYDFKVGSLGDFENGFFDNVEDADRYIAFVDTSTYAQAPAWQLRNLLILVRQRYGMKKANIICFRDVRQRRHEARSIILSIAESEDKKTPAGQMPKATGWERNHGILKAKQANLAEYMDPKKIADNSVDLNLKLMKWRIAPDLNLGIIKKTSCLLLGAGTLGSYVSRNLMGWGVRKITLVDYGKVSFSNPVRQPLFEFADCLEGGAPKATRAAEALKKIYPGVESEGHVLSVPMLGHPYADDGEQTKADFKKLQQLVDEHDVIFLLMDTRESRWLPTVMGKATGKIVINAALGFDSWVVMRHGAEAQEKGDASLGCYFCNDVVSPANSVKDQTLDQQCTVTRPGVAAIASALAVELLTSLLQHPLGVHADAPKGPSSERDPPEHPLGLVPHQIRGYVSTFQNLVIRGQSYKNCSACGPAILDAYRNEGWEFVKKALLEKDYVSELSGLAELQRRTEELSLAMDWDEEGEGQDEGDGELL